MAIADDIADRLLDRSVDLARLEAGERRKVLAILTDMERSIVAQLRQIDPTAPRLTRFRAARLEKLLTEVREITRGAYTRINRDEQRVLTGVAVAEGPAVAGAINQTVGVDLLSAGLGEARLRAIATDVLVLGSPVQEWWQRQAATTQIRFADMTRRNLLIGSDLRTMIRETRQISSVQQRHAETLVRSSIQTVGNSTRAAIFEANSDVLEGRQSISSLDTRVCKICAALSGKAWRFDGTPIGHRIPYPGSPPYHGNCRCVQIPLVQAFAELLKQRGDRLQKQLDELSEGKRREIDGELATDLTFSQWLRTKNDTTQRQILGRGRYTLWKSNKIRIDQLIDQSHRIRTLEQLRALAA